MELIEDTGTVTRVLPTIVYQRALQLMIDCASQYKPSENPVHTIERMLAILEECAFLNMARVLLPDFKHTCLRIRYAHGLPTQKRFVTYALDEGATGFVYTFGQALYIDDLDTNSLYAGKLLNPLDLPYAKPAFMGVPLKNENQEVLGVLCVNQGYRNQDEINSSLTLLEGTAALIVEILQSYRT